MATAADGGEQRVNATRPHRTEAAQALVTAGLAILDEQGVEAITVRALAARTYYSPSTVGYHTQPFRDFLDLLWRHVGSELALHVFGEPGTSDVRAGRMLDWAAVHPRRAAFFVDHPPHRPASTRVEFWTFLCGLDVHDSADLEMLSRLHFMARRLQAALDYALRSPADEDGRRAILTVELRDLSAAWKRSQPVSRPAPSRGTPRLRC